MFVCKRSGEREEVSFDKVLKRIKVLSNGLDDVNFFEVAQKVCTRIFDGVKTTELDELAAQMCSSMILDHPDYGTLASRIIISNHHKNSSPSFSETIQTLYDNKDVHDTPNPLVSDELYEVVMKNKEKLNSYLDYGRDYTFDYFGFKTLEKAYLMRVRGRVIERPQHMFMRVALGIHGSDIKDALSTYDLMSTKYFVHATPTLFNSGTRVPQMSSCYLYGMEDSIDGIFKCLKDCAHISKYAGGIGLHIHNIRARNSIIRGTNGVSTGIVPMLRVYNNTARYVNQCFTGETLVQTIDGAVRIDTIKQLDRVLTIDGSYQPVLQVAKSNVNGMILEFSSPFVFDPVRVTNVHELYTFDTMSLEKKYIAAMDFDTNKHLMAFPMQVSEDAILDTASLDFIKFCGMFKQTGRIFANGCDYSIKCIRLEVFALVCKVLKAYNVKHWVYHNRSNNYKIVRWIKSPLMPSLVAGRVALENGSSGAKAYLDGVFVNSIDQSSIVVADRYQAMDYQLIAANTGTLLCGYKNMEGKYVLRRNSATNLTVLDAEDGLVWFSVTNVAKTEYTGQVYDLNVCDNHNYTTGMGVVHNSGRRNGSIAIYMEPWHADVEQFVEMRKTHGNEEERARDLFYAFWIPDLFMKRVKEDKMWSLMCPDTCKGLSDCYGEEFERLYEEYEAKGMYVKQIRAQDLWFSALQSQIETGTPYMLYKDHVNRKNMQSNIGIVKSSNLCSEIVEVSDDTTCAVCNLASLCLPTYVNKETLEFDFDKLHEVVKVVVKNLNKVIDRSFYPIPEAKMSNARDRPIGIGIQGLADVFALMKIAFESDAAKDINRKIFETMYHAALEASCELAHKLGPYETFPGSPASMGVLQFDMWGVEGTRYDWSNLKKQIMTNGLRNSLLLAPMPTASTSQIMGFTESFEPITSNIYKRKTMAGEFILVNRYLVKDLQEIGLWTHEIKNHIIVNDGSIQNIQDIPLEIRERYKTVWECKMRTIIDMAADRGAFVDQSQSMNLYVENPDFKKLTAMHFYAWDKGLKTGMYYLRTKAKSSAQKFTVDPRLEKMLKDKSMSMLSLSSQDEAPVCETCSA